jgi:hypothetical protein
MPPSAFRSIRQDKTGFFNIRNQPKSYYQDAGDNKKTGWASERIKPKYEKLLIATEEDRLRAKKVREGWVNAMDKGVIKLFDAAPRKYIIKGQIPRRDAEVIAQYSKDQDFPIMASTFVNAMNPASLIYSAEDTARKMISYTYGRLNLKNLSKEDKKDVIKDWKQNKADALKSAKQSIPDFFKRNKELVKEIIKTQDPKATGELLATVAMIALARSGMAKDITKIKAQLKSSGQSTKIGNIIKAKWNQPKVTKIEKKAGKIYDAITEKGGGIKITPDLIRRQLTEANIRLVKNINVNTGGKSVRYNIGQKIKIDLTKPRGSFKINGKYKDGTISGFITQQGIQVTRLKGKKFEVVTTTMPSGKFKQIIYSKGKQINKRIGINKEGYFLDMSNPFTVLNRVNNLGSKYDQLIKDTKLIKSYQGETIRGNRKYKFDLQTTKKMDINVQSTRKAYYAEIGKILDLKERGVAVKVWKDKLNNLNTRIKLSNKEKMLVPDILKHSSKYLNIKRQAKLMADVKIKLDNILTIRSEKIRVNRLKNLLDKLKAKDRFTGLEVGTQRKLSNALNKWRKSGKKGQGQFLLSSLVDRLDSVLIKPSELTGKQISDLRIPETTIKQDIFIRVPPSVLQYKQLSKIYLGTKAETAGGKIRPPFFGIPQTHPSLGMKAITSPILEQEADTKQDTKTQTVQELEQEQQLDQDIVQQLKSQTIQDLSDTQIQALSQELAPVPVLDPIVDVTPLPDDPTPPQLVEFLLDLPQNPPKNKRLPFWIELPPSLLKKIKKLKKKKKYKFLFKYAPTLAGVGQKGTEKSFYSGFELRGSRLYYKKPILVHQHKRGNLKYKMFVRKHQRAKSRFKGFSKR